MFWAIKSLYKWVTWLFNNKKDNNVTNQTQQNTTQQKSNVNGVTLWVSPLQTQQQSQKQIQWYIKSTPQWYTWKWDLWLNQQQQKYIDDLVLSEPSNIRDLKREEYTTEALQMIKQRKEMQQKKEDRMNNIKNIIETTKDEKEKQSLLQQYRLQSMVDYVREKEKLSPDIEDTQILDTLNKWAIDNRPQDGQKIIEDFLNNQSDDLYMLTAYGKTRAEYDQEKKDNMSVWDKVVQQGKNILWWAWDSITWLGQFLANTVWDAWIQGIASLMKQSWADEQTINRFIQWWEQEKKNNKISNTVWSDTNSLSYKWTKLVWDLGQTLAPVWTITWASKLLQSIPASGKLTQLLTNYPKVTKALQLAGQWAMDTIKYDAIANGEVASAKDIALGAWLNVGMAGAGELLKQWANYLWNKSVLSGLLNPQKLEYVQNALKEQWDQVDNVVEWMQNNNIKWSKSTIIKNLNTVATNNYNSVRNAIKKSDDIVWLIKDDNVVNALDELVKVTDWAVSSQNKAQHDAIVNLLNKARGNWLKPSEVQLVKESMDNILDLYTLAWDVKSWLYKQDMANLRSYIRKLLEDTVEWATNININTLNKDVSVAKQLAIWIAKKENASNVRDLLSPFASPFAGGALWAWGNWDSFEDKVLWFIWWAVLWKAIWSTSLTTNAWSLLKWIWKWSISWDIFRRTLSSVLSNKKNEY